MKYHKLKAESLKNIFVHEMQEKIFSGEVQIGEQLPPEREMAEMMGISRSLVNSGLLELESQGFVHRIPRRGTIVADYEKNGTLQILVALMNYDSSRIDYPLFESMMEMRYLIECESARQAAERITVEEAAGLDALARQIGEAGHPEDALEPLVLFHYRLTQLSGNTVYAMTFKSFEPVVTCLTKRFLELSPDLGRTEVLHKVLVDALLSRDGEKSAVCARTCLEQGIGALRKQYKLKEG